MSELSHPVILLAALCLCLLVTAVRTIGLRIGRKLVAPKVRRAIIRFQNTKKVFKRSFSLNKWVVTAFIALLILVGVVTNDGLSMKSGAYFPKADGHILSGDVTHVRDGDTIEVKGVAVRLATLDCDESGTLKGNQATLEMDRLVLGKKVSCKLNGRRSYDRFIGVCTLEDGTDIQRHMLDGRWCIRYGW